jgi:hypothetical protein
MGQTIDNDTAKSQAQTLRHTLVKSDVSQVRDRPTTRHLDTTVSIGTPGLKGQCPLVMQCNDMQHFTIPLLWLGVFIQNKASFSS